eukprot:TRINITY_DN11345_c0_g1_i4.p2 TRINITY_DN11345_c0_g1~~TRINITY_DN11345_c0_g1_i4.p2  ORF type:complete len:179 (+),score=20.54 TRINITY_DN11345_c0_g1_i4:369-905(+)
MYAHQAYPYPYPPNVPVGQPYSPTFVQPVSSYPYQTGTQSSSTYSRYPVQHPGQVPSHIQSTNNPFMSMSGSPMQPPNQSWNQTSTVPGNWFSKYYHQTSPYELQMLRSWFDKVDKDHSGTLEVDELQFVTFDSKPIGKTIAAQLVKVFDEDRNGCIDFQEYVIMHNFISHMRQVGSW